MRLDDVPPRPKVAGGALHRKALRSELGSTLCLLFELHYYPA